MAKLTLNDLTAGFGSATLLDANNASTEAAVENTLSRDGTAPNSMEANLDMNSNRILNLPDASSDSEPVTKRTFDAAASTSITNYDAANGNFTIANGTERSLSGKLSDMPSVKDYGCVGDGATDDSTNFQTALDENAGGALYVPAATYALAAELVLPLEGISLYGDGIDRTILLCTNATPNLDILENETQVAAEAGFVTNSATYVSGTSVTVTGDVTNSYPTGRNIHINGSTTGDVYARIKSSSYSNPDTTINFTVVSGTVQSEALTITAKELLTAFTDQHYHIEGMTLDGDDISQRNLFISGAESVTIRDVRSTDTDSSSGGHCTWLRYVRDVHIENYTGDESKANGLGISACDNVYVAGSKAHDNTAMGITLNGCRNGTVVGCSAWDNGSSGISVEDDGWGADDLAEGRTEGVSIIGCSSKSNTGNGLLVGTIAARHIQVLGGAYAFNGKNGILNSSSVTIGYSGMLTINGANCHANGFNGIEFGGTTAARFVTISGCLCMNNGTGSLTGDDGNGILIAPASTNPVKGVCITGNICSDSQAVATQLYGVRCSNVAITNVNISCNVMMGNSTGPSLINTDHASSFIANNTMPIAVNQVSSGTDIPVRHGYPGYRITGVGLTIGTITGGYVGQTITIINKAGSGTTTVTNTADVNLRSGANWTSTVDDECVTLQMIATGSTTALGKWVEIGRTL